MLLLINLRMTIELGNHLDLTSFVVEVNNQGIYYIL